MVSKMFQRYVMAALFYTGAAVGCGQASDSSGDRPGASPAAGIEQVVQETPPPLFPPSMPDFSTPIETILEFHRALLDNDADRMLTCVYRPEFYEPEFSETDRQRARDILLANLREHWIGGVGDAWGVTYSTPDNPVLDIIARDPKRIPALKEFLEIVSAHGKVLTGTPLRRDFNEQWARSYGHRTAAIYLELPDGRSGKLRADFIEVDKKWLLGGDW